MDVAPVTAPTTAAHFIQADLEETPEDWLAPELAGLEALLGKHAAFADWLDAQELDSRQSAALRAVAGGAERAEIREF